jgi:hypothetical protein
VIISKKIILFYGFEVTVTQKVASVDGARVAINQFALTEYQQTRRPEDLILLYQLGLRLPTDFHDFAFGFKPLIKLSHKFSHILTLVITVDPKIDQNQPAGIQDFFVKIMMSN